MSAARERTQAGEDEYRIEVSAFGLNAAEAEALFDRVADAAHALDEQVTCYGGRPTRRRPNRTPPESTT